MRLRTHVLASPFFLFGVAVLAGGPAPGPAAAAAAAAGAVLPEVDKPDSLIGRLFPGSKWIHERFGHRGLTHSLLGLALSATLALPLFFLARDAWLGFLVGYASHLLLDMATLEGVPLLWPRPTRHVFPGRDDLRLDQTSPRAERKELWLSVALVVGAVALYPLAQTGMTTALRRVLGTLSETLPEYRQLAGQYEVFLTGRLVDRVSGLTIEGEWPILGEYGQGYVILVEDEPRLVSESGGAYHPQRVALRKGAPIKIVMQDWSYSGPMRGLISALDPNISHHITGTLRLDRSVSLAQPPTAFPTVQGAQSLTLTYARVQDLWPFAEAQVIEGKLRVTYRLREGQSITVNQTASPKAPESTEHKPPVEMRLHLRTLSDLWLTEGMTVVEGEQIGWAYSQELEVKQRQLAQALERYRLGLGSSAELIRLAAEVEVLEERAVLRAPLSGTVQEVRVLSANATGVEVLVVLAPGPAAPAPPPSSPSASTDDDLIAIYRTLPELPPDQGELAYILKVVDGDTVEILWQGKAEKARLVGVDTPETKHPQKGVECYGPEASQYTTATLPRGTAVRFTWNPVGDKRDKYGRLLVYLWVNLDDDDPLELFNAALIRLGYARMYPFFKFDRAQEFRKLEELARQEKRGLWGACVGYEPYK